MPKKIYGKEEDLEEDLEEEEEEEEEEEFPEDLTPIKKNTKGSPLARDIKKPIMVKPKPKGQPRFVAFSIPQRVGIADSESDEVIAEGEFSVLQAMSNIIERLERIENTLGAMLEG
jgi:hypothetical protein